MLRLLLVFAGFQRRWPGPAGDHPSVPRGGWRLWGLWQPAGLYQLQQRPESPKRGGLDLVPALPPLPGRLPADGQRDSSGADVPLRRRLHAAESLSADSKHWEAQSAGDLSQWLPSWHLCIRTETAQKVRETTGTHLLRIQYSRILDSSELWFTLRVFFRCL